MATISARMTPLVTARCGQVGRLGKFWGATSSSSAAAVPPLSSLRRRPLSIGRVLDMGGAPSAMNDNKTLIRTVNASKNSKLQAIAFDFEVLVCDATTNPEAAAEVSKTEAETTQSSSTAADSNQSFAASFQPDMTKINEVASILGVKMDTGRSDSTDTVVEPKKATNNNNPLLDNDVRSKYADKLKKVGLGGGIQAVDQAKSQIDDTLQRGDAAGHLSARQVAVDLDIDSRLAGNKKSTSGSRWLAQAGVGRLLSYLTHRSIHIALLPGKPSSSSSVDDEDFCPEDESMQDLANQLKKDVVIDLLVPKEKRKDGKEDEYEIAKRSLKKNVLDELSIDPDKVLIVSDKDVYLKASRDLGCLTCRLQPPKKNGRRGSITTHYTVPSAVEVRDVVDEINGISFNAVLNR